MNALLQSTRSFHHLNPRRVTMIDFAHTTFEGFMSDPVLHSGPDSGYLKGLDTLVDIFETALVNNSSSGDCC